MNLQLRPPRARAAGKPELEIGKIRKGTGAFQLLPIHDFLVIWSGQIKHSFLLHGRNHEPLRRTCRILSKLLSIRRNICHQRPVLLRHRAAASIINRNIKGKTAVRSDLHAGAVVDARSPYFLQRTILFQMFLRFVSQPPTASRKLFHQPGSFRNLRLCQSRLARFHIIIPGFPVQHNLNGFLDAANHIYFFHRTPAFAAQTNCQNQPCRSHNPLFFLHQKSLPLILFT